MHRLRVRGFHRALRNRNGWVGGGCRRSFLTSFFSPPRDTQGMTDTLSAPAFRESKEKINRNGLPLLQYVRSSCSKRHQALPPCSSSLSPPEFLCLVCLQITVYAVCTNLTNAVKVVMEGVGVPINIVRGGQLSGTNITIILCVPVFFILVALVSCCRWRLKRRNELQSQNNTEPLKQVQITESKRQRHVRDSFSPRDILQTKLLSPVLRPHDTKAGWERLSSRRTANKVVSCSTVMAVFY
ncbi:hypothetical protein Q8A73_009367 [Channa argus]|nr:hypothetical protein Q8A73_009367 [Channa argus]